MARAGAGKKPFTQSKGGHFFVKRHRRMPKERGGRRGGVPVDGGREGGAVRRWTFLSGWCMSAERGETGRISFALPRIKKCGSRPRSLKAEESNRRSHLSDL